jgi:hypothetical protein
MLLGLLPACSGALLCNGKRVILRQRVRGSVRAVRAVQNTRVFQTESRVVADVTSRAKPSSNGRLSHCSWSFEIFDESHQYKMKNTVGWRIATSAGIGFKRQVTPTPGFHSLYDWCYQAMWLFSGAPEDPEDETVMEIDGADALYSAVKSLMHASPTEDQDAQQDTAHRMIQIANHWKIRRWSE